MDEPITVDFPISVANDQMNKARNEITSLLAEKNRDKMKTSNKIFNKDTITTPVLPDKFVFPGSNLEPIIFEVDMQPPNS